MFFAEERELANEFTGPEPRRQPLRFSSTSDTDLLMLNPSITILPGEYEYLVQWFVEV
jgi:hypothetical protein